MGGKIKYIEMFGSFTEPFNYSLSQNLKFPRDPVQRSTVR